MVAAAKNPETLAAELPLRWNILSVDGPDTSLVVEWWDGDTKKTSIVVWTPDGGFKQIGRAHV